MPAQEINARLQAVYDQIAATYARDHAQLSPGSLRVAQRFLDCCDQAAPILDLGCGTGRDTAWFKDKGRRAWGADLSFGMLAQRAAPGRLAQMDMRSLGFPGGCFGGVWCNAALLHIPRLDVPLVLAEIRRVLAPGGLLYLALKKGSGEQWETRPDRPQPRFFARYELAEIGQTLGAAGFSIQQQEVVTSEIDTWLQVFCRS